MFKSMVIPIFFFFLHLHLSCCDVHSIICYFIGIKGLNLPSFTEKVTVNDVTVSYYDSKMKSTAPCPKWLNTTAGQNQWTESCYFSQRNQIEMDVAIETAILNFNLTGAFSDVNVYQVYSRCDLYPDGTMKSLLAHAFNGRDFLSLDIDNKRFIASVPQAIKYKNKRETNTKWLERTVSFYKKTCFDRLKMYLEHAPGVNRRTAPEVRLFQKQRAEFILLTCHVTGFYPREVQVELIGASLQPMDDMTNDVLPNGDGTYQTRRSVIIPKENPGNDHYSCVVQHSGLKETFTVTWGEAEKPFRLPVWIAIICLLIATVFGLVIWSFHKKSKLLQLKMTT